MEQKKSPFLWELREDLDISGLSFSYLSLLATSKRFIEFFFYHLITKKWRVDTCFHFKNTKFHFKIILHLFGEYIFNKNMFFLFIFWENNQMQAYKIISCKYERTEPDDSSLCTLKSLEVLVSIIPVMSRSKYCWWGLQEFWSLLSPKKMVLHQVSVSVCIFPDKDLLCSPILVKKRRDKTRQVTKSTRCRNFR